MFHYSCCPVVHMSSHSSSGKTLPCELCKQLFKTTKSLFAHYKEQHTDRQRKHVCELCGKSFRDSYHLDRKVGHKLGPLMPFYII